MSAFFRVKNADIFNENQSQAIIWQYFNREHTVVIFHYTWVSHLTYKFCNFSAQMPLTNIVVITLVRRMFLSGILTRIRHMYIHVTEVVKDRAAFSSLWSRFLTSGVDFFNFQSQTYHLFNTKRSSSPFGTFSPLDDPGRRTLTRVRSRGIFKPNNSFCLQDIISSNLPIS